jgi:hypothetical protein
MAINKPRQSNSIGMGKSYKVAEGPTRRMEEETESLR